MGKKPNAITQATRNLKGESMIILGKNDKGVLFIGIGNVCRVEKGERVDRVIMYFGSKTRAFYVIDNHARRQLFLLKRGQFAWIIGTYVMREEKGKVYKQFFAQGFLPWYVPKMLDIKQYDTSEFEELKEENDNDLLTFLDDVIGDNKI